MLCVANILNARIILFHLNSTHFNKGIAPGSHKKEAVSMYSLKQPLFFFVVEYFFIFPPL